MMFLMNIHTLLMSLLNLNRLMLPFLLLASPSTLMMVLNFLLNLILQKQAYSHQTQNLLEF